MTSLYNNLKYSQIALTYEPDMSERVVVSVAAKAFITHNGHLATWYSVLTYERNSSECARGVQKVLYPNYEGLVIEQ